MIIIENTPVRELHKTTQNKPVNYIATYFPSNSFKHIIKAIVIA